LGSSRLNFLIWPRELGVWSLPRTKATEGQEKSRRCGMSRYSSLVEAPKSSLEGYLKSDVKIQSGGFKAVFLYIKIVYLLF
jgi:hypothetical protein